MVENGENRCLHIDFVDDTRRCSISQHSALYVTSSRHPKSRTFCGSVLSWSAQSCPFLPVDDRRGGEIATFGFLWHAANHVLQKTRAFRQAMGV